MEFFSFIRFLKVENDFLKRNFEKFKDKVFVNGDVVEEVVEVDEEEMIINLFIDCKLICVEMNVSFIEENMDSFEYIGSGDDFFDVEVDLDEFCKGKFGMNGVIFFFSDKCEDLVVSR